MLILWQKQHQMKQKSMAFPLTWSYRKQTQNLLYVWSDHFSMPNHPEVTKVYLLQFVSKRITGCVYQEYVSVYKDTHINLHLFFLHMCIWMYQPYGQREFRLYRAGFLLLKKKKVAWTSEPSLKTPFVLGVRKIRCPIDIYDTKYHHLVKLIPFSLMTDLYGRREHPVKHKSVVKWSNWS